MNISRSVVRGAAIFVGGLLASTVATLLLLSSLPELFASTALFPASALFRALPIPIMAGLTLFAALTAFRSVLGRDDTRRAATDAPIYFFGLTLSSTSRSRSRSRSSKSGTTSRPSTARWRSSCL